MTTSETRTAGGPFEAPGFQHLRERALMLLGESGGFVSSAVLATELFGSSAGALADRLLASVLGCDQRFHPCAGGWRATAPTAAAPSPTGTVVAMALATTGADPTRHRVVRLAAVRADCGGIVARLDLVVRHDRRPARYLLDAARVLPDDLDEARTFPEIVSDLIALLGDDDVYAYGASLLEGFMVAELARARLPAIRNRFVEIDDLGNDLLADDRKPSLVALAAALDIPHRRPGLPLADAEVAARVVVELARRSPPVTVDALRESPQSGVAARGPESRPLVSRDWLATVTTAPGVYLIKDAAGAVLYVGKAVNLRRRLAVYAARSPALHRRLEGLIARAAAISVCETRSDLEATLLEARMLAELAPPFNVARTVHQASCFIRIGLADDPPRVQLVKASAADGAAYIGPLRSARLAQQALSLARQAFPQAFGRRVTDPEARRQAVHDVLRLLGGQKGHAFEALRQAMTNAASRGDREGIDAARGALRCLHDIALEPSALLGHSDASPLVVLERVADDRARAHLIANGRHRGAIDVDISSPLPEVAERAAWARAVASAIERDAPEADSQNGVSGGSASAATVDERTIILRWLAQSKNVIGVFPVPA